MLALLGAQHFLHVSRIRVKSLNLRLLMSYIYIYDISILRVNQKALDEYTDLLLGCWVQWKEICMIMGLRNRRRQSQGRGYRRAVVVENKIRDGL